MSAAVQSNRADRSRRRSCMGLGATAVVAARVLALRRPPTKNAALAAAAAALRAERRRHPGGQRAGHGARARAPAQRGAARSLALDDEARRGHGARRSRTSPRCPIRSARVGAQWTRPNGLDIQRVRVPLGVIGIIYESRPNVTADAGALCLKSGNAAILRGGSESEHSNRAIHACLVAGLRPRRCRAACIQLVPTTDRAAVG